MTKVECYRAKGLERISFSLNKKLLEDFDAFIKLKGYSSRAEAIREAMRDLMHPHEHWGKPKE